MESLTTELNERDETERSYVEEQVNDDGHPFISSTCSFIVELGLFHTGTLSHWDYFTLSTNYVSHGENGNTRFFFIRTRNLNLSLGVLKLLAVFRLKRS